MPMDIAEEIAALKAQLSMLSSEKASLPVEFKSIWIVYDASKISVWCSKSDCPKLNRKVTYDVVKEEESEDGELEEIITQGVTEEMVKSGDYDRSVKRVGEPTTRHHDLGVLASFTSKRKATDYIEEYFRLNRGTFDKNALPDICLSEVSIIA